MATLLMGHGGTDRGTKVVVPPGFTISFLVDDGASLPFYNGVGVILNSDQLQSGGFKLDGPYPEGEEVSNHEIHVLQSDQRGWYAAVDPEDGTCFYAGDHFDSGIALCNDPGDDGQCAQSGVHDCGGLFSIAWSDKNLIWVSCRYDAAGPGNQLTIGGEESEFTAPVLEILAAYQSMERGSLSEPEFIAIWDALGPEEQIAACTITPVKAWTYRRQIRVWMEDPTTTDAMFYAYVAGQEEPDIYLSDPEMKEKYDRGAIEHAAG